MNQDICLGCFEPLNGFDVCCHCGWHQDAVPEHAYHLKPGTILQGRYIVGNSVGMGGFGITYKAWDANLNTLVAIKEFYPAGLVSRVPGEKELVIFSGDKEEQFHGAMTRFLAEAKTMAKFTGHPNIVHVFDFFQENQTAYIVMEYLDGITVKQFLESSPDQKLPIETATEIILSVLNALSEMHSKKIIHRDISPDNIQITSQNQVKIFDFGAARLTKEDEEQTLSIVVKTGYTPPEQYRGKSKQGAFTDLYSVGAVLYKLITGLTADESIDRIVEDTLQKPSKLVDEVDSNLEKVIMKAMALKPELRFQTAAQFRDALLNKKNVDYPEIELKKRRRIRLLITAVMAVFTIAFFTAFGLYITSEGEDPLVCDNGAITVCLSVSDNPDVAKTEQQMYQDIIDTFIEEAKKETQSRPEGNEFAVEAVFVPQSQYRDYVDQAVAEGKAPTVFHTDAFKSDLGNYASKLDLLVDSITAEDFIILDEYDSVYPAGYEIPTGFYAGAIYVNKAAAKAAGVDITQAKPVTELLESATTTNGVATIAIAGDNVDDTLAVMIEEDLYNGKSISKQSVQAFDIIGKAMNNQAFSYSPVSSLQQFYANQLVYLVDDTTALESHHQHIPGYYTVYPLARDNGLIITMTKHLGVSKSSDENSKKIGMQLIRFMLSDYAQDALHIRNSTAIPVNPNMKDYYISFNNDLSFVGDYDEYIINGQNRFDVYQFGSKVYADIMIPNGDYSKITDYLEMK